VGSTLNGVGDSIGTTAGKVGESIGSTAGKVGGTIGSAASKAKVPALVGTAAAAGLAGGMALRALGGSSRRPIVGSRRPLIGARRPSGGGKILKTVVGEVENAGKQLGKTGVRVGVGDVDMEVRSGNRRRRRSVDSPLEVLLKGLTDRG
jgi:hypothetical protein